MFMTIGSFAIVTVLGREGDADHDLSRYRGLAGRQPVLALALAVLLLAQAGAPFTTGLWAKVQVVFAAVEAGEVPLGVIAMVTAVVAAYFYLRVAVLMYAGGGLGEAEGGTGGSAELGAEDGMVGRRHHPGGRRRATAAGRRAGLGHPGGGGRCGDHAQRADPARRRGAGRAATSHPSRCRSRRSAAWPSALCTGVTVLFGVWPQPLIDFANHATLLFLPK